MTPLSESQLQAMEARCEAASPGPWRNCGIDTFNVQYYADSTVCVLGSASQVIFSPEPIGNPTGLGNAAFIAASRTDLPLLIGEVRRLREALEFYADWKTYKGVVCMGVNLRQEDLSADADKDDHDNLIYGKRARQALGKEEK